jgi:hypothetical protein
MSLLLEVFEEANEDAEEPFLFARRGVGPREQLGGRRRGRPHGRRAGNFELPTADPFSSASLPEAAAAADGGDGHIADILDLDVLQARLVVRAAAAGALHGGRPAAGEHEAAEAASHHAGAAAAWSGHGRLGGIIRRGRFGLGECRGRDHRGADGERKLE